MLPDAIKADMLSEARRAVEIAACRTAKQPEINLSSYSQLQDDLGAFVTIKRKSDGRLRGCIGTIIGREPLYQAIPRLAVESAMHDPRFSPVTCSELPHLVFEISILTHPQPAASYEDIQIGRDGIILMCEGCSSVFLPQVPVEQNWDIETTLSHLAMKAGLAFDRWKKPGCSFSVFQAEVFREDEGNETNM